MPGHILDYVAHQVDVDPEAIHLYAQARPATRRQHLEELRQAFGFQPFTADVSHQLTEWLLPQAFSADQGVALLTALIEELRRQRIILPALSTLERLGWEVRQKARQITFEDLTDGLTSTQKTQLDQIVKLREGTNQSYLNWLNQAPGQASPDAFSQVVARLTFARDIGLDPKIRDKVHPNRLRQLNHEANR